MAFTSGYKQTPEHRARSEASCALRNSVILWSRVRPDETGCWIWHGSITPKGYGAGKSGQLAHKTVWELCIGPVPKGLELDHLCRVRRCVNPSHLEPVTHAENVRRGKGSKPLCKNGHPLSGDNLIPCYLNRAGRSSRVCKICHANAQRRSREKRYVPAVRPPRNCVHCGKEFTTRAVGRIRFRCFDCPKYVPKTDRRIRPEVLEAMRDRRNQAA